MNQADQRDQDDLRPEYTAADFQGAVRGKYAGGRPARHLTLSLHCEPLSDGRWLARVLSSPEVSACGNTQHDAIRSAEELAVTAIANQVRSGQIPATALYFELSAASSAPPHIAG